MILIDSYRDWVVPFLSFSFSLLSSLFFSNFLVIWIFLFWFIMIFHEELTSTRRNCTDKKSVWKKATLSWPLNIREMKRSLHKSIGVLWLCAGNDWLDVLPVGDIDTRLCRLLRRWTRLNSLDDHRWALLARTKAHGDGDCCSGELAGKLCRWNRISQSSGERVYCLSLGSSWYRFWTHWIFILYIFRPHSRTTHSCHSASC